MLEKGIILPNIHFEDPSKSIPFDDYRIRVPTDAMPWPSGLARQASVNSFGYGGTNAHAILQAYSAFPEHDLPTEHDVIASDGDASANERRLFILSGQTDDALRDIQSRLLTYLQNKKAAEDPRLEFDSLSYTLANRRSHLDCATYHIASTFSELKNELSITGVAKSQPTSGVRLGFIFTGQSAQWPRMGMELLRYKAFRQSIEQAEEFLIKNLKCNWSVTKELAKPEGETWIKTSAVGQPICTIVQVAIVDLLRSWQICPAAVVGHSSGEIAAAYCAGALTDRAAWEIAFHKGLVCEALKQRSPEIRGSMIAVGADADTVRSYLDSCPPGQMKIACYNSPSSVTVSGDSLTIRQLLQRLNGDNIFARELPVDSAYHSHHMELVSEEYLRSIAHLVPQQCNNPTQVRISSSVTGKIIHSSVLTAEYWVTNLVSPVLFSDAVAEMMESPAKIYRHRHRKDPAIDFLVEIGPHAALKGPLQQILESQSLQHVGYASVLHRNQEAVGNAMRVAGELYCRGLPVDINAVNHLQYKPRVLVDLPAYPWNRSLRYWTRSRRSHNFLHRSHPRHSLLGVRTQDSDALHPAWTHFIDLDENSWIRDHVVHGSILYPAAGFVVAAIEAALQLSEADRGVANVRLEQFEIQKALVMSEEDPRPEIITHFWRVEKSADARSSGWWKFSISCARGDKEPQQHASGRVSLEYALKDSYLAPGYEHVHQARKSEFLSFVPTVAGMMDQTEFYRASRKAGLAYGPDFRGIVEMSRSVGSCAWRIKMPDRGQTASDGQESEYLIHPTTLDVIIHTLFGATNAGGDFHSVPLPVAFESLIVSADMFAGTRAQISGYTVAKETAQRQITANIHVASANWDRPLVRIQGLRCTELPSQKSPSTILDAPSAPLGSVTWKPDIDMLDAMGLKSYIHGVQNRTIPTDKHSIRLLDPVGLVSQVNQGSNGPVSEEYLTDLADCRVEGVQRSDIVDITDRRCRAGAKQWLTSLPPKRREWSLPSSKNLGPGLRRRKRCRNPTKL
jgi:zearalenone synthase (highly reducing iterative type I polyketide synthase)